MNDIGHNQPPEETIEEIVLAGRQTRDMMEIAKEASNKAAAPWITKADEAAAPQKQEYDRFRQIYASIVAKVGRWQERQRKANPFAASKDVSRVIINGEVAATVREVASHEVFKPDLVPRELCSPDDAKIKAKLLLSGEDIPGVARTTKYIPMIR